MALKNNASGIKIIKKNIPLILGFTNQKGGAGKSTGAVHACFWFRAKGFQVILVDADGQQSSSAWLNDLNAQMQEGKVVSPFPFVVNNDPEQLFKLLPSLTKDYEIVIVDGPANLGEVTKTILFRSHLTLIPTRESLTDLRSTGKILEYVAQAQELRNGVPVAGLYLNAIRTGTLILNDAKSVLEGAVVPLLETAIVDRTCIRDASGQGTTVFQMKGTAAKEAASNYESLFLEALRLLDGKT